MTPIPVTLQTPYSDQGAPTVQKNYNNLIIDANTGGQPMACFLFYNDGQVGGVVGTVTTTERARVNIPINNGLGFQAYKCSLQLEVQATQRAYIFQAAIMAIPLAITRQSYDSYWMKFGNDASKFAKDLYIEYNASAPITVTVYYDESSLVEPFVFQLAQYNGIRNSFRQRLPPVKFRLLRIVMDSAGNDFQVWDNSKFRVKPVMQGSGYEEFPLMAAEK